MTINLEYLNDPNPSRQRIKILKEQIEQSNDIEALKNIPKNHCGIYYYAQKRLFEIENIAFKEAEFITVGNKQNKFVKVMVYRANTDNPYTKKIRQLLQFDFDAIFDDTNFDGDSYNLAMYTATYALLHSKSIRENYCFSGIIDEALNIKTPSFETKQKFAQSAKKTLLGEDCINVHEILNQAFNPDRKLILAKNEDSTNPGFKVLKVGALPKSDWTNTIKEAAKFIEPQDEVAFNGPATFAFGVGASLGSIYSYKVLHFQSGQYQEALSTSRYLKTIDYTFNDLLVSQPETLAKEFNILLHFASHEPTAPTQHPTIKIETKVKGNIALKDYTEIVRQTNNAINFLKKEYKFDKVHLVFSIPVDMAFALGWAIGKFLNASVYNYFTDSASYFKVFDLNTLG